MTLPSLVGRPTIVGFPVPTVDTPFAAAGSPPHAAGGISPGLAIAGVFLVVVAAVLTFRTTTILRLLWVRQGDAPYREPPAWFVRFVQVLGVGFVLAVVVLLYPDWIGRFGP